MTVYNWLCLLGIPGIFSGVIAYIIKRLKINDEATKAVKLGVQALLRDRLIHAYRYHSDLGYAKFDDRENFKNMYTQYHSLGVNGVMDDIYKKFLELPLEPSNKE